MHRLICRRLVALAVAYAVALNLVLPLLPAFALAAEANPAEICATRGATSPTGVPTGHGSLCPFGLACSHDCGATGFLADGARSAAVFVARIAPSLSLVRVDDQLHVRRVAAAQFARAPPPA